MYLRIIHSEKSAYGVLFWNLSKSNITVTCMHTHSPPSHTHHNLSPDLEQCYDSRESTAPCLDVSGRCDPPLNITRLLRSKRTCFSQHLSSRCILVYFCFSQSQPVSSLATRKLQNCGSPGELQPRGPASGCRHWWRSAGENLLWRFEWKKLITTHKLLISDCLEELFVQLRNCEWDLSCASQNVF